MASCLLIIMDIINNNSKKKIRSLLRRPPPFWLESPSLSSPISSSSNAHFLLGSVPKALIFIFIIIILFRYSV